MDGLNARHGHSRTHLIPVLIISAASKTLRDRADTIAGAAVAVLPKPFDLDTLLTTVQTLVGRGTGRLRAARRA